MSRPKRSTRQGLSLRKPAAGVLVLAVLLAGCAVGGGPRSSATEVVASVPESGTAGAYLSLADFERDPSIFEGDVVVLSFAATWCSTCRRTRANIEADLAGIPPGLVIVVVDYDTETDVRRQYGVTVQHTFVQIDADGTALKRWAGSLTAQQIAEQTL